MPILLFFPSSSLIAGILKRENLFRDVPLKSLVDSLAKRLLLYRLSSALSGFRSVMIYAFLSSIELWLRKGLRSSSVLQRGPVHALIIGLRSTGHVRSKRNVTSLAATKSARRRRRPL